MNNFFKQDDSLEKWIQKDGTIYTYVLEGEPIVNRMPRFGTGKCYDSQRQIKMILKQQLENQHGNKPLIDVPIRLKMNFFWKYPSSLSKKEREHKIVPKPTRPDYDNIVKFYDDLGNGTIWQDDGLIYYAVIGLWYAPRAYSEIQVIF